MNDKYPVNRGEDGTLGVNRDIQTKLTALQEHVCNKHCKVLAVRFDVRYPEKYNAPGDNKDISKMMAKTAQVYRRKGYDPAYMWTREQNTSSNPHYHAIMYLNASKIRHYNHVFKTAENLWGSTIGASVSGCIEHCTRKGENGMLIVTKRDGTKDSYHDNFDAVHYQASYIAKESGKAREKDSVRNFGMSRLTTSDAGRQ